jgi:hypothetical protein
MLAAVDAAAQVGATVVLGDVHQDVMFARYYAREMWGHKAWKKHHLQMQQEDESLPPAQDFVLDEATLLSEYEKYTNKVGCAVGLGHWRSDVFIKTSHNMMAD